MNIFNSKTISALGIYLLITVLATWFVIRPMAVAAQNKVSVLHTQYQAYQLAEQKLTRLTALSKSQANLDHAHDLISRALPPTIDQDRLLITIEKLIANNHLQLVSLINLPPTTTPKTKGAATSSDPQSKSTTQSQLAALGSIDITLEATGSYADVKQVLDSLEQLDRLITITSVTIKANQSSGQTNSAADATIHLRAYSSGQSS